MYKILLCNATERLSLRTNTSPSHPNLAGTGNKCQHQVSHTHVESARSQQLQFISSGKFLSNIFHEKFMMEALLSLIIGALFVGFFWMARHIRRNRGQLESLGIPINKPGFILGSPPYALHKLHHHTEQLEKFKQFGKTYGSYSGAIPTINTIDPDLIKSICLKNADSFDRNFSIDAPDKYNTIDISHGVVWHSLRKVLSPTFTSGKLKAMMEPMENIADEMVEQVGKVIKQTGSNVLDVKDLFVNLAMNVIGQCGFGVKIDAYNRPDEPLILHGKKIFEGFKVSNWITVIVFSLFDFFPSM